MIRQVLSRVSDVSALANLLRHSSRYKIFTESVLRENLRNSKSVLENMKISYERQFHTEVNQLRNNLGQMLKFKLKGLRLNLCYGVAVGLVCGYPVLRTIFNIIGYPASINGKSMRPTLNPERHEVAEMDVYGNKDVDVDTGQSWGEAGWVEACWLDIMNIVGEIPWQDWVWVNCIRGRNLDISRGDLLIYISPKDPEEFLIKRVIAMENDFVHTDGRWTEETGNPAVIRIPRGHVWVQGDNLDNTVDSNKYGPVSLGLVIGVATHIIWPLGRAQRLETQPGLLIHSDTVVQRSGQAV